MTGEHLFVLGMFALIFGVIYLFYRLGTPL
jgi:hypothetical protein